MKKITKELTKEEQEEKEFKIWAFCLGFTVLFPEILMLIELIVLKFILKIW